MNYSMVFLLLVVCNIIYQLLTITLGLKLDWGSCFDSIFFQAHAVIACWWFAKMGMLK